MNAALNSISVNECDKRQPQNSVGPEQINGTSIKPIMDGWNMTDMRFKNSNELFREKDSICGLA